MCSLREGEQASKVMGEQAVWAGLRRCFASLHDKINQEVSNITLGCWHFLEIMETKKVALRKGLISLLVISTNDLYVFVDSH